MDDFAIKCRKADGKGDALLCRLFFCTIILIVGRNAAMKTLGYYNGTFDELDKMTIPMNDRVCWF
ncbi:MAG: hypothetical protein Q4C50_13215, partial [Eubacteriales bacterium]|nr:hypothetical protein [Eubacteriales bacterium]